MLQVIFKGKFIIEKMVYFVDFWIFEWLEGTIWEFYFWMLKWLKVLILLGFFDIRFDKWFFGWKVGKGLILLGFLAWM